MARTALNNLTLLSQPIYLKSGYYTDVIATVADAARVIVHLPDEYGCLPMTLAGNALEAVDERPDVDYLLDHATKAVCFAWMPASSRTFVFPRDDRAESATGMRATFRWTIRPPILSFSERNQ